MLSDHSNDGYGIYSSAIGRLWRSNPDQSGVNTTLHDPDRPTVSAVPASFSGLVDKPSGRMIPGYSGFAGLLLGRAVDGRRSLNFNSYNREIVAILPQYWRWSSV
jgi:hypothetical protein